jgi:hypothetical protein
MPTYTTLVIHVTLDDHVRCRMLRVLDWSIISIIIIIIHSLEKRDREI